MFRCLIAECAVWAHRSIVAAPPLDAATGVRKIGKPMLIQAFIPKRAVEALHVSVLHRFARRDDMQLYPLLVRPGVQRSPHEFRPVIYDQHLRQAIYVAETLSRPHNSLPREGCVDFDRSALARKAVHHSARAEPPPISEYITRNVHRPLVPRVNRLCWLCTARTGDAFAPLAP